MDRDRQYGFGRISRTDMFADKNFQEQQRCELMFLTSMSSVLWVDLYGQPKKVIFYQKVFSFKAENYLNYFLLWRIGIIVARQHHLYIYSVRSKLRASRACMRLSMSMELIGMSVWPHSLHTPTLHINSLTLQWGECLPNGALPLFVSACLNTN